MSGLTDQLNEVKSVERAIRVAAFTGGQTVPSARFRVRQYLELLSGEAIIVREFPARTSAYPPANKLSRPFWAASALLSRAIDLVDARHFDVTLLQREFLSTFMTLEGLTRSPRVLDVDDAIFLHRGGGFAQRLAEASDLVICGNEFLAESFSKWTSRIEIVPTAVDPTRYLPREVRDSATSDDIVLGWIGTSGNFRFLKTIESAIASVLADKPGVRLLVVADAAPDLPTMIDAGFPNFEIGSWYGVFAPVKTPSAVVGILNAEILNALNTPEMQNELRAQGAEPKGTSAEAFADFVQAEVTKWGEVIKTSGLKQ